MSRKQSTSGLSKNVEHLNSAHKDTLEEIITCTKDLASDLGMEEDSDLKGETHKRLAESVLGLALMDAKLERKISATARAMKSLVTEVNAKRAEDPAAQGGAEEEEVSMEHFLERLTSKVSSAMNQADETALQSEHYKEIVKEITAPTGEGDDDDIVLAAGNQVNLICPLTSMRFKQPVKSQCSHTYEKAAILNHIKIKGNTAKCPVAGCSHKVTSKHLVADKAMERQLRINSQATQVEPAVDAIDIEDDGIAETYV